MNAGEYRFDEHYNLVPTKRTTQEELDTLKLALKEHLQVKIYISYDSKNPTVSVSLLWDGNEISEDSDT